MNYRDNLVHLRTAFLIKAEANMECAERMQDIQPSSAHQSMMAYKAYMDAATMTKEAMDSDDNHMPEFITYNLEEL